MLLKVISEHNAWNLSLVLVQNMQPEKLKAFINYRIFRTTRGSRLKGVLNETSLNLGRKQDLNFYFRVLMHN